MQQLLRFQDGAGRRFSVPEEERDQFLAETPDAVPLHSFRDAGGRNYSVPEPDLDAFKAETPDAQPVRRVQSADGARFSVPDSDRDAFLKDYRARPEFEEDRAAARGRARAAAGPDESVAGAAARGAVEGFGRGLAAGAMELGGVIAEGTAGAIMRPAARLLGAAGVPGMNNYIAESKRQEAELRARAEEMRGSDQPPESILDQMNRGWGAGGVRQAGGLLTGIGLLGAAAPTLGPAALPAMGAAGAFGEGGGPKEMIEGAVAGAARQAVLGGARVLPPIGAAAAGAGGFAAIGALQGERGEELMIDALMGGAFAAHGSLKAEGSATRTRETLREAVRPLVQSDWWRGLTIQERGLVLRSAEAGQSAATLRSMGAPEALARQVEGRLTEAQRIRAGLRQGDRAAFEAARKSRMTGEATVAPTAAAPSGQSVVGSGQSAVGSGQSAIASTPAPATPALPNSPLPAPAFEPYVAQSVPLLDTSPLPPSPFAAPPAPQLGPTLKADETLMVNRQVVEGWEAARERLAQEIALQAADAKAAAVEQRKAVRAGTAESKAARNRRLSMDSFWEQRHGDFGGLPMIERILAGQSFRAPTKRSGGEYDAWKSLIEKYPELGMMMSRRGKGDGKGVPIDVAALEEKMTPDEMVAQIEREWSEYQAWKARDGRTPEDLRDEEIAAEAEYNLTTPAKPRPAELKPGDMVKTPDGQWRRVEREPDTIILADGTDIVLPEDSEQKVPLQAHVPADQPGIDEARQAYTEQERAMWADAERERIAAETAAPEAPAAINEEAQRRRGAEPVSPSPASRPPSPDASTAQAASDLIETEPTDNTPGGRAGVGDIVQQEPSAAPEATVKESLKVATDTAHAAQATRKPPELMTPEEAGVTPSEPPAYPPRSEKQRFGPKGYANATPEQIAQHKAELKVYRQAGQRAKERTANSNAHWNAVDAAARDGKPINAESFEWRYPSGKPAGYVREGDRYVFKGEGAPSTLALQGQTQAEMDAQAAARQTDAQRQEMLARAAAPITGGAGDQTAVLPGMESEVEPNLFDAADIEARKALGMETGDGGRETGEVGSGQVAVGSGQAAVGSGQAAQDARPAGGGARGMAQADGTGLPGQMQEPDAAAVPADNPHYSIFPIELPEAVDFARQATGKFPKVKKRIRLLGGTALGVYRSTPQGPLGIELKRSIFELVTDQDRIRIAAEAEAWAAVNLEGNPEGELWTSAVQDRITEETDKLREQRLKENPRLASSVLLHEIGHWIDNVPDYETMMKRGNILGHLQALHGYTKQMMMEHPDTLEAAIPPRERARMRREAERAAGRRPADDAERKVWSEEVSTHYQDMLQEEAARRGLVTRAEILSELEPLIAWWHGTDSIPEYFTDPAEMYADAFSVLANNPAAMRKRAPTYFKVWQNWLAKRPQARELWERYQMDATLGRVGDMRDRRQMEGIEAANFEHEKQLRARMVWSPRQSLDALGSMLYSGAYPITRRAKKLMKRGAESGDRMMKALQDERYRHAWGAAYMMEVQDKVGRRVFAEAGVPLAEWRAFLQNRQIAENRQGIASMMGMNPAASSEALERQRQRMGDAAYNAMMQAQAQWHALRQKYVINLALEKGLVTQELADLMEQRAAYSHVAAVDADVDPVEAIFRGTYGEAGAKIYKQEGFLGLARDPWQATLELDRSLITAAYRNELKAALESMLADSGEELYRDAGTKWDANVKRMVPVTGESARASTLVYMRDGKPRSYWAPQEIVDFVDNADPVSARVLTSLINTLLRKQKGIFTWLNYGFPIFNTPRDIQDWIRNLPGWKGRLTYYHYAKRARPLVQSIVDGRPTEEAAELMRQNILLLYPQGVEPGQDRFLQSLGQKIGGRVGRALEATGPQTALERTIQGYGLRPEWMGMDVNARHDLMQRVKRWYLSPTEKGEMLRKVSAWLYLRDRFPDMSAEDVQRNVQMMGGSPDFADRARKNAFIDAVFPFYNPFLRGWQSALTAFAREPVRVTLTTMRYAIVPKLILAAIGAGYMRELLKRLLGDLGDKIGKEQQKMVQYIPQYYKDNYAVHPLWWDPTDPTGTKVVFETSPLSEFNRFAGATIWSLLDDGDIKSILDVGAEQLPGINPVLTLASQWAQVYSGQPPAGTGITQTQIDAGAAVSPMMRETWNQLSGGMLGRIPREGIGDVNLSPLEKFLRLPGVSNTLGRRLRVSNKGFSEGLREAAKPAERERAKVRTEAWRDALEYARTGTLPVEAAVRQARGAMTMAMKPDGRDTSSYLALLPIEQSRDAYYVERLHDYMLQMNIAKLSPQQQAMLKAPWTQKAELLSGYGKPPVDKPLR